MDRVAFRSSLDVLTNVLTVVACIAFLFVAVPRLLQRETQPVPASVELPQVEVGAVVDLPQAAFAQSDYTVLLGLRSTCGFCTASMDTFRDLSERITRLPGGKARLFGLGSEPEDVLREYLFRHRVFSIEVLQVTDLDMVQRTPQTVVVDRTGRVVWRTLGVLKPEHVTEVETILSRRQGPSGRIQG